MLNNSAINELNSTLEQNFSFPSKPSLKTIATKLSVCNDIPLRPSKIFIESTVAQTDDQILYPSHFCTTSTKAQNSLNKAVQPWPMDVSSNFRVRLQNHKQENVFIYYETPKRPNRFRSLSQFCVNSIKSLKNVGCPSSFNIIGTSKETASECNKKSTKLTKSVEKGRKQHQQAGAYYEKQTNSIGTGLVLSTKSIGQFTAPSAMSDRFKNIFCINDSNGIPHRCLSLQKDAKKPRSLTHTRSQNIPCAKEGSCVGTSGDMSWQKKTSCFQETKNKVKCKPFKRRICHWHCSLCDHKRTNSAYLDFNCNSGNDLTASTEDRKDQRDEGQNENETTNSKEVAKKIEVAESTEVVEDDFLASDFLQIFRTLKDIETKREFKQYKFVNKLSENPDQLLMEDLFTVDAMVERMYDFRGSKIAERNPSIELKSTLPKTKIKGFTNNNSSYVEETVILHDFEELKDFLKMANHIRKEKIIKMKDSVTRNAVKCTKDQSILNNIIRCQSSENAHYDSLCERLEFKMDDLKTSYLKTRHKRELCNFWPIPVELDNLRVITCQLVDRPLEGSSVEISTRPTKYFKDVGNHNSSSQLEQNIPFNVQQFINAEHERLNNDEEPISGCEWETLYRASSKETM